MVASSPAPNLKSNPSAPAVAGEGTVNTLKAKRAPPKQPFPSEHLERFVRHVHGSTKSRTVLVELFVDAMKDEGVSINKNTVDAKYRDLAVKKVKGVLKVADEVLVRVSSLRPVSCCLADEDGRMCAGRGRHRPRLSKATFSLPDSLSLSVHTPPPAGWLVLRLCPPVPRRTVY